MKLSPNGVVWLVIVGSLEIIFLLPFWTMGFLPSLQISKFTTCRRWRSIQLWNSANTHENNNNTETSIEQCPFFKFFPRYRIHLTTTKRSTTKKSTWLPLPFQQLGKLRQKVSIEQQLQPGEDFRWIPETDGVSALKQLWRHADSLFQSSDTSSIVIGLPDASPSLIQNWIEIFEWMIANYPFPSNHSTVSMTTTKVITGSFDKKDASTTLRIQRNSDLVTARNPNPNIPNYMEQDAVIRRTQAWVKRILVEQGICPFTKSVSKSGQGLADVGVPVGSIAYHVSVANHPVTLFADTFEAIDAMIQAGPSGKNGVSSILLAAPAFDDDFDLWSGPIFAMLEASVVAAMAESQLGVVCFHPRYAIPDGSSWPGFGHMHSVTRLEKWHKESLTSSDCPVLSTQDVAAGGAWQRRTPHATINVLRADQLQAAEAKRSSGDLYAVNIQKLVGSQGIGSDQLARDLERERQMN